MVVVPGGQGTQRAVLSSTCPPSCSTYNVIYIYLYIFKRWKSHRTQLINAWLTGCLFLTLVYIYIYIYIIYI